MSENKLHPSVNIGGAKVYINPGTGVVEGAFEANAYINIRHFVKDCDQSLHWHWRRVRKQDYGGGRYAFMVFCDEYPKQKIEIQMPGWELSKVRFVDVDTQDAWQFPRLYVDGSSWLWKYAILDRENVEEQDES